MSAPIPFRHVSIIGVGLIGGSIGLALHKRAPRVRITGFDSPPVLRQALKRRAIDVASASLEDAVAFADLVVLAAPVSVIRTLLPRVARCASSHAVITDTGSVKETIVRNAARVFPGGNFIGGHPMAGTEFSSVRAAHPLLFENAFALLTPVRQTDRRALRQLRAFWECLGSRVMLIDPTDHDAALAMLSHVPQLLAVALIDAAGRRHRVAKQRMSLGAGGFRDMTRIASSPFDLWRDILRENPTEIRRALRLVIQELKRYELSAGGADGAMRAAFARAAAIRRRIPQGMKGFRTPPVERTVFVPDRPGMLARLTDILGRAGINIKDIELLKVREGAGGTFRLAFESEQEARRADGILARAFPVH